LIFGHACRGLRHTGRCASWCDERNAVAPRRPVRMMTEGVGETLCLADALGTFGSKSFFVRVFRN
jgi:hypothetical protein